MRLTNLFILTFFEKKTKLGDNLSTVFKINFLFSKDISLISAQVNVIVGANLFSLSYTFNPKAVTPSHSSDCLLFCNKKKKNSHVQVRNKHDLLHQIIMILTVMGK